MFSSPFKKISICFLLKIVSRLIRTHRTHVGLRDDFPFLNVRTYICHHIKCYYRTVFLSLSLFDSVNQVLVVLFIVVVLPLYSFDLSLYLRNILIERGNKTMNYKRRIYNFCHHLIFVLFSFSRLPDLATSSQLTNKSRGSDGSERLSSHF